MPNNPAINNPQTPVQPNVQNNMGGVNPNAATPNINQLGSQNPSNNVNNNNNPMQQGNAGNNNPAK